MVIADDATGSPPATSSFEIPARDDDQDEIAPALEADARMRCARWHGRDADADARGDGEGQFEITRPGGPVPGGVPRRSSSGMNATLDTVVNKVFWYEQLLDAIPVAALGDRSGYELDVHQQAGGAAC